VTFEPDPVDENGPRGPLPVDPDLTSGLSWPGPQHPTHLAWDVGLVIALGGALGSLGRWSLDQLLPPRPDAFPWSTFVENVLGSLLVGLTMVWLHDVRRPGRYAHPFVVVGILGGFTTFSTYAGQGRELLAAGHLAVAGAYLAASVVAGLAAVVIGVAAARRAFRLDAPRPAARR
jgi:CrcB protein